jgi:arylsulfatase A
MPVLQFVWMLCWLILNSISLGAQPAGNQDPVDSSVAIAKPNIIVIYTDDQGYGDLSCLNPEAKFQTPNIDRLAKEGIAFTNGHSADSVCTPSRYALLTGRYPWRTRMKRGVLGAEAKCLIADERMTIASMLKKNGYQTAMVGKWHLGMDFPGTPEDRDWSQPVKDMPLDKGFDYFYGIPASLNYGILAWFEGRFAAVPPTQFSNKKKNARHMDYRIMPPYDKTPEATQAKLNRPGFEIAEDFIDNQCLTRFTDKAIDWMQGKVEDAKSGTPFFLYLPYTSPHFPVCPLPEFHGKGNCGPYGEFLIETDFHVGRILDFLAANELADNTLIVFSSDNGPENPWKEHLEDFGHDSRGGFRQGKRSVYEGGHRVPFLVRWPQGIESPNRTCAHLVGQVDLLATLAEVVGEKIPDSAGEDSQSFANVLREPDSGHERLPLITQGNGREARYAITEGPWKLIMPNKQAPKVELYQLESDSAEASNVADKHPELVAQLTEKLSRIIARGRTTAGKSQPNDTGYWQGLNWMTEKEYQALSAN